MYGTLHRINAVSGSIYPNPPGSDTQNKWSNMNDGLPTTFASVPGYGTLELNLGMDKPIYWVRIVPRTATPHTDASSYTLQLNDLTLQLVNSGGFPVLQKTINNITPNAYCGIDVMMAGSIQYVPGTTSVPPPSLSGKL